MVKASAGAQVWRVGWPWYAVGLSLVLLLALALRLIGLTWGLPHSFHGDEANTVRLAYELAHRFLVSGSLDPQASAYGTVPLYLLAVSTALAQQALSWLKALMPLPFDTAPMVYVGRLLSVLSGVVTVWLTAMLACRLFGRAVALLSALLLAVCLLPVREAHFATVDTLLVALLALALLAGERIASRGAWRDYLVVGGAIALAAGTKVTGGLVVASVLVAWGTRIWWGRSAYPTAHNQAAQGDAFRSPWKTHTLRLLTAGAVSVVLWLVLNPYVVLNPSVYFDPDRPASDSLSAQWAAVHGHWPALYTLDFTGTIPYLYVVTNWLRWGMGLPLEILALAGVAYSLWYVGRGLGPVLIGRRPRRDQPTVPIFADTYLLVWFLAYFLTVGGWYAKFIRYGLPLFPVLCVFAGRLLVVGWRTGGRMGRGVSVVVAVGVVGLSLTYTVAYLNIYRQPDVRLMAIAWLRQYVPAGASILVEHDTSLWLHKAEQWYGLRGYAWQMWNPYEIDGVRGVRFQAPAISEERTRIHLQHLLKTDYVVISEKWVKAFRAAEGYAAQAEFYQRLFSGEAGYQLVRTFQVSPHLGPFTWQDEAAEKTFRYFDHPIIYVFARVPLVDKLPETGSQVAGGSQPDRPPSLTLDY